MVLHRGSVVTLAARLRVRTTRCTRASGPLHTLRTKAQLQGTARPSWYAPALAGTHAMRAGLQASVRTLPKLGRLPAAGAPSCAWSHHINIGACHALGRAGQRSTCKAETLGLGWAGVCLGTERHSSPTGLMENWMGESTLRGRR